MAVFTGQSGGCLLIGYSISANFDRGVQSHTFLGKIAFDITMHSILYLGRIPYSKFWSYLTNFPCFSLLQQSSSKSVLNREVGRLGLVIEVLDGRCSLSSKDTWNPAGLVAESPWLISNEKNDEI
jgi:hypothetical protein